VKCGQELQFQAHGRTPETLQIFHHSPDLKHNGIISVRNRKWMTCSGERVKDSLVMMTFKRICCFKKIHELFLATIKLSLYTSAILEGKRRTIWTIYEQPQPNYLFRLFLIGFWKKIKTRKNHNKTTQPEELCRLGVVHFHQCTDHAQRGEP
jgi:hypothetical protein